MEPIKDYFGTEVNTGDVMMGARASHRGYTSYSFLLVSGRTPKMLRVMQLSAHNEASVSMVASYSAQNRHTPKAHGAVVEPWNLVKVGVSGLSETDILKAIEDGKSPVNPVYPVTPLCAPQLSIASPTIKQLAASTATAIGYKGP